MDLTLKETFSMFWKKYFNDGELPITFYYTEKEGHAELVQPDSFHRCVMVPLSRVRKGHSFCFNAESISCPGGSRYFGFTEHIMPNFEYFLSCGIPGTLEGERYKKSPELVKEFIKNCPKFNAPAQFIVFKRWDMLQESDNPEVVIFFAPPDVLSGLFTLLNFDEADPNGAFSPFGAGCATIVQYPYLEKDAKRPRGILGMFDVSARPFVSKDVLSFSISMNKFITMVENMEESFLITDSWKKVQQRI